MRRIIAFFLLIFAIIPLLQAQISEPRFEETLIIGRGHVLDMEWHPTRDILLVKTIRGAWLYTDTLQDVAFLENIWHATYKPDGSVIAGANAAYEIRLFNADTYELQTTLSGHNASITAIDWHPQQNLLATGDESGQVLIWDMETRQVIHRIQANAAPLILSWNPEGTRLAIFMDCSAVQIWNLAQQEIEFELPGGECLPWHSPYQFGWSNNEVFGRFYAEVYDIDRVKPQLWHVETKQEVLFEHYPLERFANLVMGVGSISPDHQWTAFGLWPRGYYSHSIKDFAPLYISPMTSPYVHENAIQLSTRSLWSIQQLVWNSSSTRLASVGIYDDLYVWDVERRRETAYAQATHLHAQATAARPHWVDQWNTELKYAPAWSPDSSLLAVPDNVGGIELWDIENAELRSVLQGHRDLIYEIDWQPQGNFLATTGNVEVFNRDLEFQTIVWDVSSNSQQGRVDAVEPGAALWLADGEGLLTASKDKSFVVRYPNYLFTIVEVTVPSIAHLHSIEVVSDGELLVLSGYGGIGHFITLFNLDDLQVLATFTNDGHNYFNSVAGWDSDENIWRVAKWIDINHPYWQLNDTSSDPNTVLIDVLYGATADTVSLIGHTDSIVQLFWHPDGKHLMSVSQDGTSRLWDVETGETLHIFDTFSLVTWSPNGRMFGGLNPELGAWEIYDTESGALLQTLTVPHTEAGYLFWSPDSQKIAHVHDGITRIWVLGE